MPAPPNMPSLTRPDAPDAPPASAPRSPEQPASYPQPAPPLEESSFMPPPPPPPPPISTSDNPDAIALRSAIAILHIQRERSKAHLNKLEELKHLAAANPHAFARDLAAGRVKSSDALDALPGPATGNSLPVGHDASASTAASPHFAAIPTPQNVIRCPPVNWAKYHIVGTSLDRLHEEQRTRPVAGEPQGYGDSGDSGDSSACRGNATAAERAPEALLAAPYRPLVDKIEPMRTRSVSKK